MHSVHLRLFPCVPGPCFLCVPGLFPSCAAHPYPPVPQTAFWRPTPPDPQPHPLLIPTIRPFHLDLPDGVTIFNAAIQQSNDASQPPAMVLLFNDRVFINRLTREGNALDPAVQAIGVFLFHPQ